MDFFAECQVAQLFAARDKVTKVEHLVCKRTAKMINEWYKTNGDCNKIEQKECSAHQNKVSGDLIIHTADGKTVTIDVKRITKPEFFTSSMTFNIKSLETADDDLLDHLIYDVSGVDYYANYFLGMENALMFKRNDMIAAIKAGKVNMKVIFNKNCKCTSTYHRDSGGFRAALTKLINDPNVSYKDMINTLKEQQPYIMEGIEREIMQKESRLSGYIQPSMFVSFNDFNTVTTKELDSSKPYLPTL